MAALTQAVDAHRLSQFARQLMPSPMEFEGTLEELCERFILSNLPSAASVTTFHEALVDYIGHTGALFLLRAVRGTERRHVYATRDGTRFKATDNAPAWWIHAALLQDYTIQADAFAHVMATLPTHLFDVAATCGPTANAAGWHIAHLFDVKDGRTDFERWGRLEVVARFIRNVHPCNYFLLPNTDWKRWGGDARILGFFGALYAERYADVWPAFLALARVEATALHRVTRTIAYSFGQGEAPAIKKLRTSAGNTPSQSLTATGAVEYRSSRLTFKRDVIEALKENQVFRIITPVGTFEMTKADVYRAFPKMVKTRSYREAGVYHTPSLPSAIEQFRVNPSK